VHSAPGLLAHRRLIWEFTRRDLRARFAGSAMGLFWSVVQPLLTLGVFLFLFAVVLDVRVPPTEGRAPFALFLVTGMLPWLAFQETLLRAGHVVLDNAQLVKKTRFPAKVLPVYLVLSSLVLEAVGLLILGGALVLLGPGVTARALLLPVVVALQLALTLGLAWAVAGLAVYVRDLPHLTGAVLTVWLYLTPIVYPESLLPGGLRSLLAWNPFRHVVVGYRALLLEGRWPSPESLLYLAVVAAVVVWAGSRLFDRLAPTFSDVI
jgi:ABC-type polysaccharide/polyol phosphate export permease